MKQGRAGKMPLWVKVFATNFADLSPSLETHLGGRREWASTNFSPTPTAVMWHICSNPSSINKWHVLERKVQGRLSPPLVGSFWALDMCAWHKQAWNNQEIPGDHMRQNAALNFKNSFCQYGLSFQGEYSGRKCGLRWRLENKKEELYKKGSHFIPERQLSPNCLGVIKAQSSYKNTTPVKSSNEASAPNRWPIYLNTIQHSRLQDSLMTQWSPSLAVGCNVISVGTETTSRVVRTLLLGVVFCSAGPSLASGCLAFCFF